MQDVLLGPCVNIKISHCALCQDSGLKIWLAENEESQKEAPTVAGGSYFLMQLLMTMICMGRADGWNSNVPTVKMKMSKMVGGIESR